MGGVVEQWRATSAPVGSDPELVQANPVALGLGDASRKARSAATGVKLGCLSLEKEVIATLVGSTAVSAIGLVGFIARAYSRRLGSSRGTKPQIAGLSRARPGGPQSSWEVRASSAHRLAGRLGSIAIAVAGSYRCRALRGGAASGSFLPDLYERYGAGIESWINAQQTAASHTPCLESRHSALRIARPVYAITIETTPPQWAAFAVSAACTLHSEGVMAPATGARRCSKLRRLSPRPVPTAPWRRASQLRPRARERRPRTPATAPKPPAWPLSARRGFPAGTATASAPPPARISSASRAMSAKPRLDLSRSLMRFTVRPICSISSMRCLTTPVAPS